jgi:hypothetical protein
MCHHWWALKDALDAKVDVLHWHGWMPVLRGLP